MGKNGLSPRDLKMLGFYVQHFNGARAAREAGFAEKSARRQATRIINSPEGEEYIRQAVAATATKQGRDKQRLLDELWTVALSSMGNYFAKDDEGSRTRISIDECTDEQLAALSHVSMELTAVTSADGEKTGKMAERVSIRVHNKMPALTQIARIHGWDRSDTDASLAERILEKIAGRGEITNADLGLPDQPDAANNG